MTDAAVRVTQSVVESFTDDYLRSIGCEINKHGVKWEVTPSDDPNVDLLQGTTTLVCDADDVAGGEKPLHPESGFFQDLLEEAGQHTPVGALSVDSETTGVIVPEWLQESNLAVKGVKFVPYYDRTAAVVLFRIGIETVSEYQQRFLRSVTVDARSKEVLPRLDETVLELTEPGSVSVETEDADVDPDRLEDLIDLGRDSAVADVRPTIDELHREASRAADSELEEYRQMQQQREEELREELANHQSRIEVLSERIDEATQQARVEALKERKECKTSYEKVEAELNELRQRREQGFPDRQAQIRERHALEVVVTPLTVTMVQYERGEIEIEVVGESVKRTITAGYGSGVGVTDEFQCTSCERNLTDSVPLGEIKPEIRCRSCS